MRREATTTTRPTQKRRGEEGADVLRRRGTFGIGAKSEGSSDILGRRSKGEGEKRVVVKGEEGEVERSSLSKHEVTNAGFPRRVGSRRASKIFVFGSHEVREHTHLSQEISVIFCSVKKKESRGVGSWINKRPPFVSPPTSTLPSQLSSFSHPSMLPSLLFVAGASLLGLVAQASSVIEKRAEIDTRELTFLSPSFLRWFNSA